MEASRENQRHAHDAEEHSEQLARLGLRGVGRLREGGYVPFGPFLALGGLTAMVFGPQAILAAVGLR